MRVTDLTRKQLAVRREARTMRANGYRLHETDWEVVRGYRWREVIVDARVSVDGLGVWTKIGAKP